MSHTLTDPPSNEEVEAQYIKPQPLGDVCVNCGSDRAVFWMKVRPGYKMCFICGDKKPPREAQE